jgi:hypothetical protein
VAVVGYRVTRLGLFPDHAARDAHLLPGDNTTAVLGNSMVDALSIDYTEIHDDGSTRGRSNISAENATAGAQPPVTIEFVAGFAGSAVAPRRAHGVTFDPGVGRVTLDNPLPANTRLQNFLVTAIATARNGTEITTAEAWKRVHVHESVRRIWLTPDTVTEHAGEIFSFTVLAEFDDGVVANVTRMHESVNDWADRITWDSDDESVVDNPPIGALRAQSPGDATVTATFQLVSGGPAVTATGRVHVVQPWAAGAEVALEAGDAARRAHVPNILFLAEGFADEDRAAFDEIVAVLIDGLGKNHLVDPWPMLRDSVNFWSAFVPGRQAGVTQRSEIYFDDPVEDEHTPRLVPQPENPGPSADTWQLRHLVHEIGLPVPDDVDADLDELLPKLRERFGEHITKDKIEENFERWLTLANRRPVNDRDSVLCFKTGAHPRARIPDDDDSDIFEFDRERRVDGFGIRDFLSGMRHDGATIGADLWGPNGKDRGLVCVLTRSSGRSVAQDDFFVVSVAHSETELVSDRPSGLVELLPIELPEPGDDLDWLVYLFAHECGHAFGLGDEYGESAPTRRRKFERASGDDTDGIEQSPNLHAAVTLELGPGQIDATRIKWASWLRIADAAVVATAPMVAGSTATLEVRDGAAARFAEGERVRVRQRLLHRNERHDLVYRAPVRSGPLKVKERPDSGHLVVESDGAPAEGETALADLGTIFATNPHVIVYKPTRHPIPGHVEPTEVPVLSPLVRVHIATTDKPLNAKPDEPYVCVINDSSVQQPRNMPLLPTQKPCYQPLIIGIYDGGARFHCGVFHPGGICVMRSHRTGGGHRRFCQVCRYVLVDMIDPSKHGALDAVYFKEYAY